MRTFPCFSNAFTALYSAWESFDSSEAVYTDFEFHASHPVTDEACALFLFPKAGSSAFTSLPACS